MKHQKQDLTTVKSRWREAAEPHSTQKDPASLTLPESCTCSSGNILHPDFQECTYCSLPEAYMANSLFLKDLSLPYKVYIRAMQAFSKEAESLKMQKYLCSISKFHPVLNLLCQLSILVMTKRIENLGQTNLFFWFCVQSPINEAS